jgi:hypothetical protein
MAIPNAKIMAMTALPDFWENRFAPVAAQVKKLLAFNLISF